MACSAPGFYVAGDGLRRSGEDTHPGAAGYAYAETHAYAEVHPYAEAHSPSDPYPCLNPTPDAESPGGRSLPLSLLR